MSDHKRLPRILLVAAGAVGLAAAASATRRPPQVQCAEEERHHSRPPMLEPATDPPPSSPRPKPRPRPSNRFAIAATFTMLFFAGGAFSAGAGDELAGLLEEDVAAELAAQAASEPEPQPAPEPAPTPEPEPQPQPQPEPAAPEAAAAPAAEPAAAAEPQDLDPSAASASEPAAPAPAPAAGSSSGSTAARAQADAQAVAASPAPDGSSWTGRAKPSPKPILRSTAAPRVAAAEPEHAHESGATVWLNRTLPDPTPASARLTRPFARALAAAAREHDADWAAVLGVLRAQGKHGSEPAAPRELRRLAAQLSGDVWRGALALSGRTSFADRAEAFADYYRAVGVEALVTGLEAAKPRLVKRLLADERVDIYAGGRVDIAAGRIDVRIVVLLSYLAERHNSLYVSSLFSGHRKYARPGVVSAHTYGHAVDIAAVGGRSILGNSRPGGVTEAAVRSILLLPSELQPQQVISLLGLGGPSFPLSDHADHVHVGY